MYFHDKIQRKVVVKTVISVDFDERRRLSCPVCAVTGHPRYHIQAWIDVERKVLPVQTAAAYGEMEV